MTAILQLSDTHIVPEGMLVSGRLSTDDALKRLITRISSIRDQLGQVDALLVSGDLSDDGSVESYERFQSLISPLALPTYVVPGNHDVRDPMRTAFADHLPGSGPLDWSRKIGDLTLIGLDTLVEGKGHGTLTDQSLGFLHKALTQAAGEPVLIALHHPPFACGIGFMDNIGLTNRQAFRDIVGTYSGALRIVCGHIHSMIVADVAGHIAISAPSPCSSFAFDCRSGAPIGYMTEGDGCLLHRVDAGFQTVRIGPQAGSGPFPF